MLSPDDPRRMRACGTRAAARAAFGVTACADQLFRGRGIIATAVAGAQTRCTCGPSVRRLRSRRSARGGVRRRPDYAFEAAALFVTVVEEPEVDFGGGGGEQ